MLQGLFIEELDATERDRGGGPSNLLFIGQIEKVLTQLFIAELVRAELIILGQLPDGARVSLLPPQPGCPAGDPGLLSSCGKSSQLHILKHPLL